METFDRYNDLGKNNIRATRSDFIKMVGEDGLRDIVKNVFLGGNVRDITEFITQRRLINSYSAMLDLFINGINAHVDSTEEFASGVASDLIKSRGDARIPDLWLLGLTQKGLDNIVRTEENIVDYQYSFSQSMDDAVKDLEKTYGTLSGTIEVGGQSLNLNWHVLSLMLMAMGAQTLSIRGSSKSMNGKMFEKLVLGSLLSIMGFTFLPGPPDELDKSRKYFWLSNMDENEREIDATVVYNEIAIGIDIGFIGRGNPEITLDKVTRFNAYKQIGGLHHDMSTIIIVDTVSENSDLFNKAERVNGHVLQMKDKAWTIKFSNTLCEIMNITHELSTKKVDELEEYFNEKLANVDMQEFVR